LRASSRKEREKKGGVHAVNDRDFEIYKPMPEQSVIFALFLRLWKYNIDERYKL
jgi:hypothetical protein